MNKKKERNKKSKAERKEPGVPLLFVTNGAEPTSESEREKGLVSDWFLSLTYRFKAIDVEKCMTSYTLIYIKELFDAAIDRREEGEEEEKNSSKQGNAVEEQVRRSNHFLFSFSHHPGFLFFLLGGELRILFSPIS